MKIIKFRTGFMLIELMVSISIATVLMAVVLFGYRTFSNRLAISAASQQVAVAVRQAQTYTLSAKELVKGGGDFNTGYGVSFSLVDPTSYYIFSDKNNNGIYDGTTNCSASAECINKEVLKGKINITSFCGTNSSGIKECPPANAQVMNIVFKRPNPDAQIIFTGVAGTYKSAELNFSLPESLSDGQSQLTINSSGQVYATGIAPAVNISPASAVCINNGANMTIPLSSLPTNQLMTPMLSMVPTGEVDGLGNSIMTPSYTCVSGFNCKLVAANGYAGATCPNPLAPEM